MRQPAKTKKGKSSCPWPRLKSYVCVEKRISYFTKKTTCKTVMFLLILVQRMNTNLLLKFRTDIYSVLKIYLRKTNGPPVVDLPSSSCMFQFAKNSVQTLLLI